MGSYVLCLDFGEQLAAGQERGGEVLAHPLEVLVTAVHDPEAVPVGESLLEHPALHEPRVDLEDVRMRVRATSENRSGPGGVDRSLYRKPMGVPAESSLMVRLLPRRRGRGGTSRGS